MKVKKCTSVNYCVCAIAARTSSDIYVIDRCDDDSSRWRFDFMSCAEDILHVVKKMKDEYKYEVREILSIRCIINAIFIRYISKNFMQLHI